MATRNLTVDDTVIGPDDVLIVLAQDGATEDSPTSVTNIAVELNASNPDILPLLDKLEDLGLAQYETLAGQFMAWLTDPGITPETAQDAYNKAAGVKPAPKAVIRQNSPAVAAANKSVQTVDTTPTTPVESDSPNNEGDTVDSTETQISGSWENTIQETHYVPYDANNVTGHMIMPDPEFIPAPPEGVNSNMWELAFTAATKPARMYWYGKVTAQLIEYKDQQEKAAKAKEETPAVIEKPRPIDPLTGLAFPF